MQNELLKFLLIYLALINVITMFLSGKDKRAAIKGKQRTPESTLFMLSAMGGSIGMLLSMKLFHHKTRKYRFSIGIPLILIGQIALAVYLFYLFRT